MRRPPSHYRFPDTSQAIILIPRTVARESKSCSDPTQARAVSYRRLVHVRQYWQAFCLFGQGGFDAGDRTATLTVVYATDGGFAGNFGPNATNHPWGTMTIVFTTCGTLRFQYQANAGLPSDVPQGSGTKTWTKLFGQNGLTCD